jgi:hypothetical protein
MSDGDIHISLDVADAIFPIKVDPTSTVVATNDKGIRNLSLVSYVTARDAAAGEYVYDQPTVGQAFNVDTWYVYRIFASFAIPDIPAGAVLTAASLFLYGYYDASTDDFDAYIHTSTYSNPLVKEDFDLFDGHQASGAYNGTILNNAWNSSSYSATWNEITFNAAGLAAILAKENDTFKMAMISKNDYDNTAATDYYDACQFYPSTEVGKEPYLSITFQIYKYMAGQSNIALSAASSIYADRKMSGQLNTVFNSGASMFADRKMSGQLNIIFNSALLLSRDKNLAAQADIVFDSALLLSRIFEMAGGQADIVFNTALEMCLAKIMAGQADIVFAAAAAMYAERAMTGQVDITFDSLMAMYAERGMTGQADIVFNGTLLLSRDLNLTAQADIILSTYLFMGLDGDSGLITRY